MIYALPQNIPRNAVLLLLIALLHGAMLVAIGLSRSRLSQSEPEFRSELFYITPTDDPVDRRNMSAKYTTRIARPTPRPLETLAETSSTAPLGLPTIDWQRERERAAEATAESLGESIEILPLERINPLFPAPLHRQGDSQRLGNGELITWTDGRNGRCYVTNQPSAVAQLDERVIVTICKPRDTRVRDDLFDSLRPRYLDDRLPLNRSR